jgi:hypothetical protein
MKTKQKSLLTFLKETNLDLDTCEIESSSGTSIYDNDPKIFEIDPKEFLEYSIQDCQSADSHGFINALSNVKRAIECQSDIIHFSLGIPYKKLNFPIKIENLQRMGLTPPNIFKKINETRVELEHFYKRPSHERVADAIEIAQLFIDVTTLSLSDFWDEFFIIPQDYDEAFTKTTDRLGFPTERLLNGIKFDYEEEKKRFKLVYVKGGTENPILHIDPNNFDDYIRIIYLTVQIGKYSHNFDEKISRRLLKEWISSVIK